MARVLVVDADVAVLEVLVGGLVALGHEVLAASDGFQAREVLNREREGGVAAVAILITDLQMPRLDGLAILAHVHASANPIPTIVVSGSWSAEQRTRARSLGAARLYEKPVNLAQLARDVEELAR